MICDASPMRIHYGRAGLPAAELSRLTELYRELGSHYKVAAAIGRTSQATWQVLKRIGVINPKKRQRGVMFKGEKFTPDYQGFMRSTTFASRQKGCTRLLHRVMWEDRHGKIPKKQRKTHMFLFRDGKRSNCALSNLMFVSRKEAAKYRAWNGNGWTKWNERHTKLVQDLKRLELAEADPEEIEKARQALEALPPWKGNGDPKKRRRQMLRRWKKWTPEQRADVIARAQRSKRAKKAERYAALPEYAIAMLPERERSVLQRCLRDGESLDAIGASLGLTRGGAHCIVRRALKKLPTFSSVLQQRVAGVERWIYKQAIWFTFRFRGVEKDDLVQEGLRSAFAAAAKYDPKHGASFLTFCARGIKWSMDRLVRETSKTVRTPSQKFFTHSVSIVSLDAPVGEDGDTTYGDVFCGEEESTTSRLDTEDRLAILRELIARLSKQEQEILRRRFFEHETLEVIGNDMGVTKERIRQIEGKALRRLRGMPQMKKFSVPQEAAA